MTILAIGSWIRLFLPFYSSDGSREKTDRKSPRSKPMRVGDVVERVKRSGDNTYELCYVAALVGAPAPFSKNIIRTEGLHHAGLLFRSKASSFVLDYCATEGMFRAILPRVGVGMALCPPKPTLALKWSNAADVFVYEQYDENYWTTCVVLSSLTSQDVLNAVRYADAYRKRYNRYSLWSVRTFNDSDANHVLYEDKTCEVFVFEMLRMLSGSTSSMTNLDKIHPRSVCVLRVKRHVASIVATATSQQTEMIVQYFRDLSTQIRRALVERACQNDDDDKCTMHTFFQRVASVLRESLFAKRERSFCYVVDQCGVPLYARVDDADSVVVKETLGKYILRATAPGQ